MCRGPASAPAFFEVKTFQGNNSNYGVDKEHQADLLAERVRSHYSTGASFDGWLDKIDICARRVRFWTASLPGTLLAGTTWILVAGSHPPGCRHLRRIKHKLAETSQNVGSPCGLGRSRGNHLPTGQHGLKGGSILHHSPTMLTGGWGHGRDRQRGPQTEQDTLPT
ncbi:hypothetical protein THAOC_10287 [Thalassiosira oceanica]|uniref:Uncharacterized protein n=1 Tax=Thalassiosira oceanica TaxID=159749 RepID=K0SU88_THAOC|nr:hypothetical protein THAOC_10287 [Thalassiosira oceanica]|eukprot:EJK68524.1 hypothetical protein THAOC_10287 [Thalassiosira oceanica]